MTTLLLAFLLLVVMLVLLASGAWVAICLLGVGMVAVEFFTSAPTGTTMARRKAVNTEATRKVRNKRVINSMELMKTTPVIAPTFIAPTGTCNCPVNPR